MAVKKNGVYKASVNAKGWLNILSDVGKTIIEENVDLVIPFRNYGSGRGPA